MPSLPEKKKIKIFIAGDSTAAIKETKAYPETGWGIPFVYFWDSPVTVVNRATNGRYEYIEHFAANGQQELVCCYMNFFYLAINFTA